MPFVLWRKVMSWSQEAARAASPLSVDTVTPFISECRPIGTTHRPARSLSFLTRRRHESQNHTLHRDPLGSASSPQHTQSWKAELKSNRGHIGAVRRSSTGTQSQSSEAPSVRPGTGPLASPHVRQTSRSPNRSSWVPDDPEAPPPGPDPGASPADGPRGPLTPCSSRSDMVPPHRFGIGTVLFQPVAGPSSGQVPQVTLDECPHRT